MKQIHPRIENGMDSASDVFQNTEKPVSKKNVPIANRINDSASDRYGRWGFWRGGGGFGSNNGTRVVIV